MHQPGLCCRIHSACYQLEFFNLYSQKKQFSVTNHCSIVSLQQVSVLFVFLPRLAWRWTTLMQGRAAVSVMFCMNLLCRRINWLRAVLSGRRPACAGEMTLLTRAPTLLISGMNLIWAEKIKAIMAARWSRERGSICHRGNNILSGAAE